MAQYLMAQYFKEAVTCTSKHILRNGIGKAAVKLGMLTK